MALSKITINGSKKKGFQQVHAADPGMQQGRSFDIGRFEFLEERIPVI